MSSKFYTNFNEMIISGSKKCQEIFEAFDFFEELSVWTTFVFLDSLHWSPLSSISSAEKFSRQVTILFSVSVTNVLQFLSQILTVVDCVVWPGWSLVPWKVDSYIYLKILKGLDIFTDDFFVKMISFFYILQQWYFLICINYSFSSSSVVHRTFSHLRCTWRVSNTNINLLFIRNYMNINKFERLSQVNQR